MGLGRVSRVASLAFAIIVAFTLADKPALAGMAFQPVSQEELQMKSEPLAPGASAIILYRQVDRDDNGDTPHEDDYFRIKILTDEGRKYADVEIPFDKKYSNIAHLKARTIRPDGSAVDFDGTVYEKWIARARGLRYLAKVFTLPNVRAGSILEYYFTVQLNNDYFYNSHWILSEELFTKKAKFSLRSYHGVSYAHPIQLRWTWRNLPPGTVGPTKGGDDFVTLEATNIPAFPIEDYMPPENELKSRVDFIYNVDNPSKDAPQFWKDVGKARYESLQDFIGKDKAMSQAVSTIVSPSDAPEVKLKKIYARVQQMRNTSYEVEKTTQQEKREHYKPAENVEDVWKRGYGSGVQVTWLYLALAKAAGFDAYGVLVADRRNYFFVPQTMESSKLDSNVVLIKLNGKDSYFDPGAAHTPFGLLTWSETGVYGLRLDKDGGSWIQTPVPPSSESRIERTAKLKLSDTGDLEGTIKVSYVGLEAMYRRIDERNSDDTDKKKFLEEEVKNQVPSAAELTLTNHPDWQSSEPPLVAEFTLKVPGWASSAGRHEILPVGLFSAIEKRTFEHADRVHPIYFSFPFEKIDDVTVELPPSWQVVSVPQQQNKDAHIITYSLKVDNNTNTLHVTRKMTVDIVMLEQKYYTALRNFYQLIRTGDEEQIVLQPAATAATAN